MLEVFKFLVFCLISVIITSLSGSLFYICALLLVLTIIFYDFDFTIGLERHAIGKVKRSYLKVRKFYTAIFEIDQNISRYHSTPKMNSVNKQTSSFDLSRFNKSGNAVSPITNNGSSFALSSKRLIQSRQTSTPLTKTLPWQKNSISPANSMRTPAYQNSVVTRSPRYSLSSVNTTPKSTNHESPSTPTIQTVTGPLLASTRFNVNLGTYTDTKSPGLASRVVQYHNELSGNQTSTHQAKYGSPGQFPIVQLYKKELPILARSPRRCTVRIAPPDPLSYNSDQANTILRDSFLQNNVESSSTQADTEINTKSVLEALKEISRKRIHTNDDIDDISKRQRKGSVSTSSTSSEHLNKDGKRMREDTPPKPKEPTSPNVNSAPKRICVVNEIESSLSSSRLMRLQQGQKRKASLHATQNLNKQRRVSNGQFVSRQTQTHVSNGVTSANSATSTSELPVNKNTVKRSTAAQTEEPAVEKLTDIQLIMQNSRRKHHANDEKTIEDIDEMNSTLPFVCSVSNPPKPIFREEPLEIMRQNKLEVMIAALSGKEPDLIPLPTVTLSGLRKRAEANADAVDAGNKEVISILSPRNKVKHDKHVTFAIPNSDETNTQINNDTSKLTENSDMPSAALPAINFDSNPLSGTSSSTVTTPSKSSALSFASTNSSLSFSAPLSFGSPANSTVSSPSVSLATSAAFGTSAALTSPAVSTNNLTFGSATSSLANSSATTITTGSNSVISSPTIQNADKSVKPTINFGVGQSGLNFASPAFGTGSSLNPPTFGGLVPSSTAASSAAGKSADSTPSLSSSTPATTASVGFQLPSTKSSTPNTGANLFGTTATVAVTPTLAFSAPSLTLGAPLSQPTLTFGGAKPPAFPTNAGNTVTTSVTPAAVNFGTSNNQTSSMFPVSTAVAFGTTTPSAVTTTASGMFGMKPKPETTLATTAAPSFSFGPSTTSGQTQNKSGGFKFDLGKPATNLNAAQSKTEPAKLAMFGSDTGLNKSGAFSFGPSNATTISVPAFGTTSTSKSAAGFGAPNTTNAGVFGGSAKTSTTVGGFGTPNKTVGTGAFGTAATNTNAFGTPTTTANTGGFGTPSAPANTGSFGTSASTNAGLFGPVSAAPPAFGAGKPAESASGFGTFVPSNATQNTGFGNFSTPTTTTQASSTFGFGATPTTQSNNTFGNAPATTTSQFTFGTNTATKPFAFSGSSGTATTTASAMFGSATPTTNSTNLFANNTNSAFGTPTGTSNAFGTVTTTTTASTFGQPSAGGGVFGTASAGFGTATSGPVFGGTSNNTTNNNNNTFGSPNAFGTPAQQSSTFGTGSSNQANVFGSNNASQGSAFGATNANQASTFGTASSAPAFGGGFGGTTNAQQTSGFGTFGSPSTTQTPIQQSGVFAFGGAPAPAAAAASAAGPSANAFQFGGAASTPAKPSGFNFSANTSTPNINFGAPATPAFGAAAAPAFGSPSAASSQFNAQAPSAGMFSIGSGSTAPKQRPMIKARRRT